jgi:hypothetical protein
MANKEKTEKINKIYNKINNNLKRYHKRIHKNLMKMSRMKDNKRMKKVKTKNNNKYNNNKIRMSMLLFNNKIIFKENPWNNMNILNRLKIYYLILRDKMSKLLLFVLVFYMVKENIHSKVYLNQPGYKLQKNYPI